MPALDPLLFFGTPDFAVPTLEALVRAGRPPRLVFSQPARPVGRGRRIQDPPVARVARELGLEVMQPERLRRTELEAELRGLAPGLAVVVAYGAIFRRWLLDLPRRGFVNLHASLLPRHRGAAPIQAAIAGGERSTGVTTMEVVEALDAGPILMRRQVEIGAGETAGELSPRLARIGAELVVETIEGLEAGELEPIPQDGDRATYAPRLSREDGEVDWSDSAVVIFDKLRAYTPWPGLATRLGGERVKLLECSPSGTGTSEKEGTILGVDGSLLLVACGGGSVLRLARVQRAGRGPVSGKQFADGQRLRPGDRFR